MVLDTKYSFLSLIVSEISSFLALHMAGLAAILDLVPEEVAQPCASRFFLCCTLHVPPSHLNNFFFICIMFGFFMSCRLVVTVLWMKPGNGLQSHCPKKEMKSIH